MKSFLTRGIGRTVLLVILALALPIVLLAQEVTPEALNDEYQGQLAGSVVTVPVLANDLPAGHWVAATVRIVDPQDLATLLTTYVADEQGVWTVNQTDGAITFTPCSASGVPHATCTGPLVTDPYPIDYIVEDLDGALSNPAVVTIGYGNDLLSGSLLYFESTRLSQETRFTWVTAADSTALGFYLLVEAPDGSTTRINDQIIPLPDGEAGEPQRTAFSAEVDGDIFYLQEVLADGMMVTSGPFSLGFIYGENPLPEESGETTIFLPLVSSAN